MANFAKPEPTGFLKYNYLDSIQTAIAQGDRKGRNPASTLWKLTGFATYKIPVAGLCTASMPSNSVNFHSDQTILFRTRNTKESIKGSVISCDDDGIVIDCERPLPADAKLISVSFDPAFIYRALEEYLSHTASSPSAKRVLPQRACPIS